MSGPSAPNDIRLLTSTTTLPVAASPISAATSAKLVDGTARTMTSAVLAAAAFESAMVAPVAVGDAAGILRIARR